MKTNKTDIENMDIKPISINSDDSPVCIDPDDSDIDIVQN